MRAATSCATARAIRTHAGSLFAISLNVLIIRRRSVPGENGDVSLCQTGDKGDGVPGLQAGREEVSDDIAQSVEMEYRSYRSTKGLS